MEEDSMEYEDGREVLSFIAGLALGTALGAGVALLVAPQSGRRTRRKIVRFAEDIGDGARDRIEDARDRIEDAGDDVRRKARDVADVAERSRERIRDAARRSGRDD